MNVSKRLSNGSVWCAHCGKRIAKDKGIIQITGESLDYFGQPRKSKMLIQVDHLLSWVVSSEPEMNFHKPERDDLDLVEPEVYQ